MEEPAAEEEAMEVDSDSSVGSETWLEEIADLDERERLREVHRNLRRSRLRARGFFREGFI